MTLPSIYYDEGRNFELLDVERIPLAGEEVSVGSGHVFNDGFERKRCCGRLINRFSSLARNCNLS
jgi:hypothetical protein